MSANGKLIRFKDPKTGFSKTAKVLKFGYDSVLAIHKRKVWDPELNKYRLVGTALWVIPFTDVIE